MLWQHRHFSVGVTLSSPVLTPFRSHFPPLDFQHQHPKIHENKLKMPLLHRKLAAGRRKKHSRVNPDFGVWMESSACPAATAPTPRKINPSLLVWTSLKELHPVARLPGCLPHIPELLETSQQIAAHVVGYFYLFGEEVGDEWTVERREKEDIPVLGCSGCWVMTSKAWKSLGI